MQRLSTEIMYPRFGDNNQTMKRNYAAALASVIPGGAHTYSRGDDQYPANAPQILVKGKGAYVWDPDGQQYLDYGMALRSVTLGYVNERVNSAAMQAMEAGVNLTRASTLELEAAEAMVGLIPGAEMVKFAKNGSNVTSAAIKLARAYTGKPYVCIPRQQPFFSFDDWFIGSTPVKRGIPENHYSYTLTFDYNDIQSLNDLFSQYPNQIAAVMLEPATTMVPCTTESCGRLDNAQNSCANCPNHKNNFLVQVQHLCKKEGAVFILDEMITGFRWHLQGAQTYFGVEPDLSTFGKGMANGFSVAALVGKREIMELGSIHIPDMERTFLISTTHGAEMTGLAAFLAVLAVYRQANVIDHLWAYGTNIFNGINDIASELGLSDYFFVDGNSISMNYVTKDQNSQPSLAFRTLFAQEMLKNNVLIPWIAPSFAHGAAELEITLEATRQSLKVYKLALEQGIDAFLQGPVIKPVFRKYN